MSKQSPRPSVRKLSSFDIRSIPKKPPVPSLDRIRRAAKVRRIADKSEHENEQTHY
jgi:hypothetical protein